VVKNGWSLSSTPSIYINAVDRDTITFTRISSILISVTMDNKGVLAKVL